VTAVCGAGVDIVQLRDKHLNDRALLARAEVARQAAHAAGALFVLNDRPDLAVACGADGVHVGQDDVTAAVARRIVGPDALVGLSTHAPGELAASAGEPVDYVSAGPVEATPTKPGRPGTGLGYIRLAAERSPHPFFVTGGISPATLPAVAAAGATRFVVVRALTEAADPAAVAAELRRLLDAPG
jgi:thiamine-phosphate pyrophosphorylase